MRKNFLVSEKVLSVMFIVFARCAQLLGSDSSINGVPANGPRCWFEAYVQLLNPLCAARGNLKRNIVTRIY